MAKGSGSGSVGIVTIGMGVLLLYLAYTGKFGAVLAALKTGAAQPVTGTGTGTEPYDPNAEPAERPIVPGSSDTCTSGFYAVRVSNMTTCVDSANLYTMPAGGRCPAGSVAGTRRIEGEWEPICVDTDMIRAAGGYQPKGITIWS